MDTASRSRIVLGSIAVIIAALASMALLNVLLEEPLPLGENDGDGGDPGGNPIFDPGEEPNQNQQQGGDEGRKKDPCQQIEPPVKVVALTTTVIAMGLWVMAVWWRQKRQTRVMNGWAIGALLVTLLSVTAMFAWWIIHKVCSLDVFDLNSCLEVAHSLRNAFIFFLVVSVGLLGFSIIRMRNGQKFWSLWSIAGMVFVYLAVLALVGWLVAEDMCDRQFEDPDLDDIKPPDGGDDPGDPGGDPNPGGNPGGSPGLGGGQGGGTGGGGGGAIPAMPEVSPFALLVILGIAALVTVLVLAVKGRQDQQRAMAMAALDAGGREGMIRLFMDTDLESNDGVIATYRRFLDQALLTGAAKKPHETPREHAKRASEAMDIPFEDVEPLLEAYLAVRLGTSPLEEERRTFAMSLASLFRPKTVVAGRRRRKR